MSGCIEDYSGGGYSLDLNDAIGGAGMAAVQSVSDSISLGFSQLGGGKRKRKKSRKLRRSNKSRLQSKSRKSKSKSKRTVYKRKSLSKSKLFKKK